MPDGADKEQARKALNERGNRLAYEAVRSELLRADLLARSARGADGVVLAQPFQRASSEGESALAGRRLRRSGDPAARARPIQGSGAGHARAPRHAAVSGQQPECRRARQRELRPRAHGAAHPRGRCAATPSRTCSSSRACSPAVGIRRRRSAAAQARAGEALSRETAPSSSIRRATISAPRSLLGRTIQGRGFAEVDEAVT